MNFLIYGAGAIGCHIGYCMYQSGHNVYLFCRGHHYLSMKKNGMNIKVCDNKKIIEEKNIKEDKKINFIENLSEIKNKIFDYIFITVKLRSY